MFKGPNFDNWNVIFQHGNDVPTSVLPKYSKKKKYKHNI